MSPRVTVEDLDDLLGVVDPLIIQQILATQATRSEVTEALVCVEHQRYAGACHAPMSPRVATLRALLENMFARTGDAPVPHRPRAREQGPQAAP